MNDADLGQNIGDQSQDIDGSRRDTDHWSAFGGEAPRLDPSRWWFASSAFPMIAGTLGPVASAFSILALVSQWRMHVPPGHPITEAVSVPDPRWLIGINAAQLAIALVANLFLLLNMTRKVRFSIAQPITIVGWYVSAICLTALTATAGGPLALQPEIEYVWSQAFYYGIFAAILYFIVASLMSVTVWGAQAGHYEKDFELSTSQRTLMLQTIMFLVYLLVGALIFSTIEGWTFLDAVYWADVTLFTVGYGDFSPSTKLGRGLLVPYALIGIISLGLVIGSIRSLMLDRGKSRLDARMLEKNRRHILQILRRKGRDHVLEPIENENEEEPLDWNMSLKRPRTEFERRQEEFKLMRKIQRKASKKRRWTALAVSGSTWFVLWLVGAKIFQECEAPYQNWSYFDGFYFAFTGLTTIGYGDLTPISNSGKAFFVFWSLLALPTMTVLISNSGDTVVKWVKDGTLKLGNLTILPGEHGFKKEIKQVMSAISCGIIFDEDIEDTPPGILGAAQPHRDEEDDTEKEEEDILDAMGTTRDKSPNFEKKTGQEQAAEEGPSIRKPSRTNTASTSISTRTGGTKRGGPSVSPTHRGREERIPSFKRVDSIARDDIPLSVPKSRAEYHLTLIDEIARVTQHLQHSPPRKYTFKEWAWYLRLMGEDESNPTTHRKPARKQSKDMNGPGHGHSHDHNDGSHPNSPIDTINESSEKQSQHSPISEGNGEGSVSDVVKWSWVGHRSPLMDTKEEAEWILERLEKKLREELQTVLREEQSKEALGKVRKREENRHDEQGEREI
ncbi:hypothetical protein BX600DRAFT_277214 [Xylariales sp. PMI_506]|nr:hypothetical protein BX600DRAFT_277214 [Xylariales sp. PMI_506]